MWAMRAFCLELTPCIKVVWVCQVSWQQLAAGLRCKAAIVSIACLINAKHVGWAQSLQVY
eukprot:1162073-Pelagomonas_calceolata.AAC.2